MDGDLVCSRATRAAIVLGLVAWAVGVWCAVRRLGVVTGTLMSIWGIEVLGAVAIVLALYVRERRAAERDEGTTDLAPTTQA